MINPAQTKKTIKDNRIVWFNVKDQHKNQHLLSIKPESSGIVFYFGKEKDRPRTDILSTPILVKNVARWLSVPLQTHSGGDTMLR